MYHIITTISPLEEEEIVARYKDAVPYFLHPFLNFHYFNIETLVECVPLQILLQKVIKEGKYYNDLAILTISEPKDIKRLMPKTQDFLRGSKCLLITKEETKIYNGEPYDQHEIYS